MYIILIYSAADTGQGGGGLGMESDSDDRTTSHMDTAVSWASCHRVWHVIMVDVSDLPRGI